MGKLLGFLEYDRLPALGPRSFGAFERLERDPQNGCRVEEQKEQAARCMYCGIPFCHSGLIMLNGRRIGLSVE